MTTDPDYILEIKSRPITPAADQTDITELHISPARAANRPYISVFFECCRAYQRIYRNRAATSYVGRCPTCLRQVQVRIGPEGTDSRFFRAT